MDTNITKGKKGEDLAAKFLQDNGFKIIERNWHFSRYGEIDIIAKDKNTLAFIEVKTRTSNYFGSPIEAINKNKMTKIIFIAQAYLNMPNQPKYAAYRFDAVCIILNKTPEITYFKDIYQF